MSIAILIAATIITNIPTTDAGQSITLYVQPPIGIPLITLPETVKVDFGVDKTQDVVCMSKEYFSYLTNWMTKISTLANREWRKQHQTESGRREWHGNQVRHYIDQDNLQQITEYEDGYRLVENMKPKRTASDASSSRPPSPDYSGLPSRLAATKRERDEAKKTKVREIIVNHTANGGTK